MYNYYTKVTIVLVCASVVQVLATFSIPTNTAVEISKNYGFETIPHKLKTKDGYILTIFRLTNKFLDNLQNKQPILLQHGTLGCSDNFVASGSDSLAFILANNKFDVWLGNNRGNFYGREHIELDPDKNSTFWRFSFDEFGQYDSTAIVDYILKTTKREKLVYISYSQGSTTFFAMTAGRPEYNEKIKLHISLTPAVFLSNSRHPALLLGKYILHPVKRLAELIGFFEIKPVFKDIILYYIVHWLCGEHNSKWLRDLKCNLVFDIILNTRVKLLDFDLITNLIGNTPAGISIFPIFHYVQNFRRGDFGMYDWGREKNYRLYGNYKAPTYNLSQVTAPTAIFWAPNDGYIYPEDQKLLSQKISNLIDFYRIPHDYFTHFDILCGYNRVSLVYNKILQLVNNYNN
ncbi:lipase 1-like [Diabrotica undecimpunctata]|uniref:lipase 1-like n=1 Tax=Diabrotica undecimpunctata TaxID=50387 RepID=UPI003B63D26F